MRGWMAALAAGLVIAGAPVAALGGSVQQTVPISGYTYLCNGVTVSLSGSEHLQVNQVQSGNGALHLDLSINFQDVPTAST